MLQEEENENICQDEDVDEVKEEENEGDMVPSKLGDVWETPLSPSIYDNNPETENSTFTIILLLLMMMILVRTMFWICYMIIL
jgi:hypothetical protein